jgi:hypothetical protein
MRASRGADALRVLDAMTMLDARTDAHEEQTDQGTDRESLLVVLGLQDLLAAIDTTRADMVTAMDLTCRRLDCGRRIGQKVVRAMRASF